MSLASRIARNERKRRHRQRHRLCARCYASGGRNDIVLVGSRWLCARCVVRSGELPAKSRGSARLRSMPRARARKILWSNADERRLGRRVDAALRYGFLILRSALYLLFWYFAQRNEVFGHAFTGFLIADVASWLLRLGLELRHATLALFVEFVAHIAVVWLCYDVPGLLELPQRADDRGIVAMTFFGVFSIRVVWHAMQDRLQPDS